MLAAINVRARSVSVCMLLCKMAVIKRLAKPFISQKRSAYISKYDNSNN